MKTILVAEDNANNYLMIQLVLRKKYNIIHANDGLECFEMYKSQKPDMILMDINMPNMNGIDVTKLIRQSDQNVPIIALTANVFDKDRDIAMEAGCNGYLTKPIQFDLLYSTIATALAE